MADTADDLYANTGNHIYLRLSGIYYQRKGTWVMIDEVALPAGIRWAKLHELQRAAYQPMLRAQGLI